MRDIDRAAREAVAAATERAENAGFRRIPFAEAMVLALEQVMSDMTLDEVLEIEPLNGSPRETRTDRIISHRSNQLGCSAGRWPRQ